MKISGNSIGFQMGIGLVALAFLAPGLAGAADYPIKSRAISIIVPFAPGGANDVAARVQAPVLEKELGVSVVVVNKPGASTQVGMTQLVQAKPDGHTLGLLTLPGAMLAYLDPSRKAIYSRKDFKVVALQSWDPNGLAVKTDSPHKNLKDLVEAARANPEKIKVGTSGLLSTDHRDSLFLLMKRNHPVTILLIFGISQLLTLSCAYACYDDFLEADFLSTDSKYESQDADGFLLEKQNPASVAAKPLTSFLLLAGNSLILGSVSSLPPGMTDPTLSALRC